MKNNITELFDSPEKLSSKQRNWLHMVSSIPAAKEAFGDKVTEHDLKVASDAAEILIKHSSK